MAHVDLPDARQVVLHNLRLQIEKARACRSLGG